VTSTVVLIFLLGSAFLLVVPRSQAAGSQDRRFGFGFVNIGALGVSGYNASTFFKAMFLTPPYPSTIQFLMNNGIFEVNDPNNQAFLLANMQMAQRYPAIHLGLTLAFNISASSEWNSLQSFLNTLSSSPYRSSLSFIGFSQEQMPIISGGPSAAQTDAAYARMNGMVTSAGFQFVSYYPQGWGGTSGNDMNYLWMVHSNDPMGDDQATLSQGAGQVNIVGQTVGLDGIQPFPSPGCSSWIYGVAEPAWSLQPFAEGFIPALPPVLNMAPCHNPQTSAGFPATIDQVLSLEGSQPVANRQYLMMIAGNSGDTFGAGISSANLTSFAGVSGISTHFLWDNPQFRAEVDNWMKSHPGAFLAGNGTPTTTTTTTPITTITNSTISMPSVTSTSTTTTTSPTNSTSQTSSTTRTTSSSLTSTTTQRTSQTGTITGNQTGGGQEAPNFLTTGAVVGGSSAVLLFLVSVPIWLLRGNPKRSHVRPRET
jgi:hypothetical protein